MRRSRPSSSAASSGVVPRRRRCRRSCAACRRRRGRACRRGRVVALGLELDGDVDDAAGVADEVRRPEDAARAQRGVELVVGQLVVRRARDRLAAQRGDGVVVEHAAERARREHVDLGGQRCIGSAQLAPSRRRARACAGRRRPRRAPRRPRAAAPPGGRRRCRARSPRRGARRGRPRRTRARRSRAARPRSRAPSTGWGRRSRDASPVTCCVRVAIAPCRAPTSDVLRREVVAAERFDRVAEVLQHRLAAPGVSTASSGRSMITPLPPPSGSPATAVLKVIARDRRSTSRTAARESSYAHIRHPPSAGPRAVRCTATIVNNPDRRPRRTSNFSCARGSG